MLPIVLSGFLGVLALWGESWGRKAVRLRLNGEVGIGVVRFGFWILEEGREDEFGIGKTAGLDLG